MTIAIGVTPNSRLHTGNVSPFPGISWLCEVINDDGGIPAGNPGDESGCWTTAATLGASIAVGYYGTHINAMINFLLEQQRKNARDSGGWPLVVAGKPMTVATADCVRALIATRSAGLDILDNDTSNRIDQAINKGVKWLIKNHDLRTGAWSNESKTKRRFGDSIFATCSAAIALNQARALDVSRRQLIMEYIQRCQDPKSGGFYPNQRRWDGQATNISDTAKAVLAIKELTPASEVMPTSYHKAQKYLKKQGKSFSNLKSQKISLRLKSAPGETVVNNNTVCDLLIALSSDGCLFSKASAISIIFLENSFDATSNSWRLSDHNHSEEISTWPTADWVLAQAMMRNGSKIPYRWILVISKLRVNTERMLVLIFMCTILLTLFRYHSLEKGWVELENGPRKQLLSTLVIGIIVSVMAAAFWDTIKYCYHKITDSFLRRER